VTPKIKIVDYCWSRWVSGNECWGAMAMFVVFGGVGGGVDERTQIKRPSRSRGHG
jgi:hypothetical protein